MYDGHGSHLTYETVCGVMKNEVIIVVPPHTTHVLQPLDVDLFKLLKTQWQKILLWFSREARMKCVDKTIFSSLLKQLTITNTWWAIFVVQWSEPSSHKKLHLIK